MPRFLLTVSVLLCAKLMYFHIHFVLPKARLPCYGTKILISRDTLNDYGRNKFKTW